jgi:hypothetical protein
MHKPDSMFDVALLHARRSVFAADPLQTTVYAVLKRDGIYMCVCVALMCLYSLLRVLHHK